MTTGIVTKKNVMRVVLGVFAGLGVVLLILAYGMYKEFFEWVEARPVDLEIDVSQPGTYRGAFTQTCEISHAELLCLAFPEEILEKTQSLDLVKELRFDATITDKAGKTVVSDSFAGEPLWGGQLFCGAIPVVRFHPFRKGDYLLTLEITQGQPDMVDTPVRFIARYELCGMEMMPAFMTASLGGILIALAGFIWLVMRVRSRCRKAREQKKKQETQHTTDLSIEVTAR